MRRKTVFCCSLVVAVGLLVGAVQAFQSAVLTTNKGMYNLRQPVRLTITNTGSEPVTYPVVYEKHTSDPTNWHGLTISNAATGEVVVRWPRLLMYYKPFEPGERRPLRWDQTYSIWEDDPFAGLTPSPLNGRQVPAGTYEAQVIPDLRVTFVIVEH